MDNIIFITVGNRDIDCDTDDIPQGTGPRKKGEYILKDFNKYEKKIRLPIIDIFLESINDKKDTKRIYLIATDQERNERKNEFWANDTINFAEIIKKKLQFPKKSIEIITIRKNVISTDYLFAYFKVILDKKFEKLKEKGVKLNDFKVYAELTGGMPPINTALLIFLIYRFRDNLRHYYIDKKSQTAFMVNLSEKIWKEVEKIKIQYYLKNYNYQAIASETSNEFIKKLSQFAYYRLTFNYDKSKIIINELTLNELHRNNILEIKSNFNAISKNENNKLIEIYYSARIKFIQQQYADFLSRLYNFTDNHLLNDVKKSLSIEGENKNIHENWSTIIEDKLKDNKKLKQYLQKQKINSKIALNYRIPGVQSYYYLMKFLRADDKYYERIMDNLVSLSKLRNSSIAAHGFHGISLELINSKIEDNYVESFFNLIDRKFNYNFNNSDYNKINKIINNIYNN